MKVHEITPPADTGALLAGAQFADAFRVEVEDRDLDARRAAERMMARQPRWAEALVSLRNLLVAPLGLKTSGAGLVPPRDMIGIFPVVSQTPDRLIAGFNDRHLDFRVVVDVTAPGGSCRPCCVRWRAETQEGLPAQSGRAARYSDPLFSC